MADAHAPPPSCLDLPLRTFLDQAAAKEPTPGGGSVSAVVAAAGCALILMAARYSRASKSLAEHAGALDTFIAKLERARAMLGMLADDDMAAYQVYAAARRGRAESDEAKAAWQRAVHAAIAVPLEVVATCAAVLGATQAVAERTSRHLVSDLAGGAMLLGAAARSAALNVRINLADLDDKQDAATLRTQLTACLQHVEQHEKAISRLADDRLL